MLKLTRRLFIVAPLALAAPAFAQDATDAPRHRQFDFWVGEWQVQNRHIQPDGTWKDGDVTRARIVPVCGKRAVLEEWAGPFSGSFMNGFSLRAFDPARNDWNLLLFWTSDSQGGRGSFGTLRGTFRHGRGEFFAGSAPRFQRYSFSDGLPNSVRWDSATTNDNGITWKTDWIMEFSRTRAAAEVTQDEFFAADWNAGALSTIPSARHLDWLVGEWTGVQTNLATNAERDARLRARLINKDCLLVDVLEVRGEGDDWDERLAVRGHVAQRGAWESWSLTETDTVLRRGVGTPDAERASFETPLDGGASHRETIFRFDDSTAVIEEEERASETDEYALVRVTELTRAD